MNRITKIFIAGISGIILVFAPVLKAQSGNEIRVSNVEIGQVAYKTFSLSSDSEVKVFGKAASLRDWDDDVMFYGWILNSKTRKVVWHFFDDSREYKRFRNKGIKDFDDEVDLPKGNYIVYYTGAYDNENDFNSVGDFFDKVFSSNRKRYKHEYKNDLSISVASDNLTETNPEEQFNKFIGNAVVSFNHTSDERFLKKYITVKNDAKIKLVCLGEGRKKSVFDYGWIYDLDRHERIWSMEPRKSDWAGGGEKNIEEYEELTLPKGNYAVYYVTDDSHAYSDWNTLPPDDPQMWGLTIWAVSDNDLANISENKDYNEDSPVVEITKVRDDAMISKGLKVDSPVDVRLLCLGEATSRKEVADYGWIVNADNQEVVWQMDYDNSEYAGGGEKNRMCEQILHLNKGSYIVYYRTDDSHAYRDWNTAPPFDPEKWGITIWTVNKNDKSKISSFDPDNYQSPNVIAQITHVGDGVHINKTFTLRKETKVRIYAIGEGGHGEMHDYGWIENRDTGREVWEMTYRKTEHAGGAHKNRLFNDTIILPAGEYKVTFVTDDSHSFRDWNDDPPNDPDKYGITLYYEN